MKYFLIFLVLMSALLINTDVEALSCTLVPFSESFDRHDLLLHGTLIDKQPSSKRGLAGQTTQLTFDTIKVYKGDLQETFVINADLAHDDIYRIGADYVIFADKTEDGYLRDLCVPNYVSSDEIIMFLDDYTTFPPVGIGVYSLYDVVEFPKRYDLDLKVNTYINLNRGEQFLERAQQTDMTKIYSCDFAEALSNPVKYDSHNRMVSDFMEKNPTYETYISSDLDSNPQTGKITYVGKNEILEESAINAKVIGNCFFVYDIKVINKDTEKITAHLNSQEGICMAENSQELFPDFCPIYAQEFPNNDDSSTSYSQQWIIKAILLGVIVGGIAVGIFIAIKLWKIK